MIEMILKKQFHANLLNHKSKEDLFLTPFLFFRLIKPALQNPDNLSLL
jgi:hypothetical protein